MSSSHPLGADCSNLPHLTSAYMPLMLQRPVAEPQQNHHTACSLLSCLRGLHSHCTTWGLADPTECKPHTLQKCSSSTCLPRHTCNLLHTVDLSWSGGLATKAGVCLVTASCMQGALSLQSPLQACMCRAMGPHACYNLPACTVLHVPAL